MSSIENDVFISYNDVILEIYYILTQYEEQEVTVAEAVNAITDVIHQWEYS